MKKVVVLFVLVVLMSIGFNQTVTAGVKPIASMPDYDGTYYGTPYTGGDCDSAPAICDSRAGRQMFTALYRDNYNRTVEPACAGERCGSHAGVDIAVVSGTQVRAALAGRIIESGCKQGPGTGNFGGTIVIEANNPYVTGNKVYLVYAHLDDWNDYAVGQTVSQGAVIGLSGGDPNNGVCPGGSGGAHLHFQVDKNPPDANGRPWFPPQGAEQPDSNFTVTQYTHNPLPFVLGVAYNFTFGENSNKELWGAINVNAFGVVNSDLWVDSSSAYPYVGRSSWLSETTCGYSNGKPCSREITLDANIFKRIYLNLNFKCYNNPVTIWYRGPDDIWRGGSFNYDTARAYHIYLGNLTYWNGIISDIMIQPSRGCTATLGPQEYFIKQMYLYP